MKKNLFIFIFLLITSGLLAQEQILFSFDEADPDTNFWAYFDNHGGQHYQTSVSADSALGWINITYPTDNVAEGNGALRLDYSAQNIESWGGYTKLEHWNPDTNAVYDWSLYDTLSLMYYNAVPQSIPGRVHLRVNLHDVSSTDNYNVYDVGLTEYFYSFQYVLDDATMGWHEIKIPLVNNYNWDGNGFNLTGWSGVQGNQILDKDKIKGFSFEFSINGGGEGDYVTGSILLDKMALKGVSARPMIVFNGKVVNNAFSQFTWGQSNLEAIAGAGENGIYDALLWTQGNEFGNGFSGAGWNIDPPTDITLRWDLDSLKLKMKTEDGVGPIRFQFESGADGKVGSILQPITDNEWHEYSIPLRDFVDQEGTTNFNPSAITVFQFLGEASAQAGKKIYFEHIWTGSPVFDLIAPAAPALVSAVGGDYVNLITWTDVPDETNEVYDIYSSFDPITDVTAPGVEVVQKGVAENLQVVEHTLRAPAIDQEVTYYYAVICRDAAGNESELAPANAPVTNTAQGVTTIYPQAPANFVSDGDLSEWAGITPFKMIPYDPTTPGSVVTNTDITDAADLSAMAYIAMDNDYMYVAFDIEDDIVSSNPSIASYLRDAPDLFIGLYDWRGETHYGPKRGAEPDYQIRFNKESVILGNVGDTEMGVPGDGNYAWVEKFPSGYAIEMKFAFADIAAAATPDDAIFTPEVGKRIKIDFSINDADATGSREGILTYSPANEDKSWAEVNRWTYTWIGDKFTDVDELSTLPMRYELSQNYPNPFNPTTKIRFSVVETGNVTLKVFNSLGQEVKTLVNEVKAPGVYETNFDASELSSGLYIYKIQAGSFVSAKKMMFLK